MIRRAANLDRRAAACFLFLWTVCPFLVSQSNEVDGHPCSTKTVLANAAYLNGKQAKDLTASDFKATVGGQDAKVSIRPLNGRRIIVVVDNSTSMQRGRYHNNQSEVLEYMVSRIFDRLPESVKTGLVVFATNIEAESRPSDDRKALLNILSETLKNAPRKGKEAYTAINDSVEHAATLFGDAVPGDALVVITDGGDNKSKQKARDLHKRLTARGIRWIDLMEVSELEQGDPVRLTNPYEPHDSVTVSSFGGRMPDYEGDYLKFFEQPRQWSAPDKQKITDAANDVADTIVNTYLLRLEIANGSGASGKVRLSARRNEEHVVLKYGVMDEGCRL